MDVSQLTVQPTNRSIITN